jgi:signal transduction histidine kinase
LDELTKLSGASASFVQHTDPPPSDDPIVISTIKDLADWNDEQIARINFTRTSDFLGLYRMMTFSMLLIFLCSIITVLAISHFTTRRWINKPLKLVKSILKSGNRSQINELQQCPGEFKDIGVLFGDFITQRDELRVAKEKAEESDQLKSAFLSNLSHEIRTPMNGILGFAQLLREPDLTGENQQQYIKVIEKSCTRMLNIITNIVNISKVESGQVEVKLSTTNINGQIEKIYRIFKPDIESKGIRFTATNLVSSKEVIIKTDGEKIHDILFILVGNANKFTHDGSIEFGYKKKDQYLEFFVKDTGDGISHEKREIIFERFRQGSESHTRNYDGAGLGLSIAKSYVEMLGGKIWVESELGKGSTFYFNIPYAVEPKQDQACVFTEEVHGTGPDCRIKNLKILIAEDDETSKSFLAMVVKKYCKEIHYAVTGIEAIQVCQNHPDIDLIFMDVNMPQMNGYEATRRIREFNKDVVIIIQTAFGLIGDREKALETGCDDYLAKPFSIKELLGLVQKHLNK